MSSSETNLNVYRAAIEGVSSDARNSMNNYIIGYLSGGVSEEEWRNAIESAVEYYGGINA